MLAWMYMSKVSTDTVRRGSKSWTGERLLQGARSTYEEVSRGQAFCQWWKLMEMGDSPGRERRDGEFHGRITKYWDRLPREAMPSLSLVDFKPWPHKALSNHVQPYSWACLGQGVGLETSCSPHQSMWPFFYIPLAVIQLQNHPKGMRAEEKYFQSQITHFLWTECFK